jgi:hypothetical protein
MSKYLSMLEQAIEIELKTCELYMIFRNTLRDDASFWNELATEELNHASLIKGVITTFLDDGLLPTELESPSEAELGKTSHRLDQLIAKLRKASPSRETAFTLALEIENSAGELHFQQAMEAPARSPFLKVFQELNNGEEDHARRIRAYMNAKLP